MGWLTWDAEQGRLVEIPLAAPATLAVEPARKEEGHQGGSATFVVFDESTCGPAYLTPEARRRVRGFKLAAEILDARDAAHAKHGAQSIEGIDASDPRWLSILVEEVGEVAHALTYDSVVSSDETERLRLRREALEGELVDVLAVASAWLDASRTARGDVSPALAAADEEAANDTNPNALPWSSTCSSCAHPHSLHYGTYCSGGRHSCACIRFLS